jgi:class 3 adenylate cyclase
LQAFRDIFTSETLAPNTQLAVRQITILFTDLKGSTHFYATRGDAPSYAAVCAHFEFLRRVIGEHGGGIVKTIGDAVMAAFPDPTEAVAACYQIQREAPRQPDAFVIKMGLCSGSAIAVNTNGILDYFGQTVNRAARIQQQSEGGDIVLPDTLLKDASLAPLLATCRIETLTVHLRGDDVPMSLARLQVETLS